MDNTMGGFFIRMRRHRLRKSAEIRRTKVKRKRYDLHNRVRFRQRRRLQHIKDASELIISAASIYIAAVVNSTEGAVQVPVSDRLPVLIPGIVVLAAGGIMFLIARHLENGRKK